LADYGTNSAVQLLAFGASDSNQDTRTAQARSTMTQFINSHLNRGTDISSPGDAVTECCNLGSAGLILTGQMQINNIAQSHPFFMEAIKLLDLLKGDVDTDAEWGTSYPLEMDG